MYACSSLSITRRKLGTVSRLRTKKLDGLVEVVAVAEHRYAGGGSSLLVKSVGLPVEVCC